MINSLVGSPPSLNCELLGGTVCCLFLSLVPGMVLGAQQVFGKYLVNKWPSRAENSTGKHTETCELAACRGRADRHGVKGDSGQAGLFHFAPCTEPLHQPLLCPGVRCRVSEASGQGLQDLCSSVKLKTVSR